MPIRWTAVLPCTMPSVTGDEKVAEFLFKAGSDPFAKNADGYTPLDFARAQKNSAVADELKNYMGKRK